MNKWPDEICLVLGRLLDGEYEPEDAARLVAWLREEPGERDAVYALFYVDGELQVDADFDPAAFVAGVETRIAAEAGESDFVVGVAAAIDEDGREPSRVWRVLPWLLAAVASLALVMSNWSQVPVAAPVAVVPVERPVLVDASLMALLVNGVDAEFAIAAGPEGVKFRPGPYRLLAGAVHLRFVNGVDLVVRAPAEWVIKDAMRVDLTSGAIRAFVPEEGQGFSIDVPGAVYEDIGTEFGVQVDGATSELHVFSGAVKLHRLEESQLYQMGQSIRVGDGGVTVAAAPDMTLYPTPAELHYLRWRGLRQEMPASPGLLAYLPMDERRAGVLPNLATGSVVSDGRLLQSRWVSGRWSQKPALLFDGAGDRVEMDFVGEYRRASLALWLKVDRIDSAHTSLLSSDGEGFGGLHWKLNRDGTVAFAIRSEERWRQVFGPSVPLGRWVHLVATIDLPAETIGFYLNGKLLREERLEVPIFAPGSVRLGDWLPEEGHPEATRERGFYGRMGEFAAWNRIVTADEVAAMWQAGSPDPIGLASTTR